MGGRFGVLGLLLGEWLDGLSGGVFGCCVVWWDRKEGRGGWIEGEGKKGEAYQMQRRRQWRVLLR